MVIAAYQAERTIRSLIREIKAFGLPVIVVNDASTDATALEARSAGAQVLTRKVNGGKGRAIREGFAAALKQGFSWVLVMDSDGQHLPSEIPHFMEVVAVGQLDVILGNRMGKPRGMPFDRWLTNKIMSWLLSRMTGQWIPDSQCGFRMISADVIKRVKLNSERYEIESELLVKAAWAGFQVTSIPVSSVYRRELSFIRPLRDTFRFFLFLRNLRQWRK